MVDPEIIRDFISEQGEIVNGRGNNRNEPKPTRMIFEDASSVSAKILVPQLGTDRKQLAKGEVDVRRFTNISEIDVLWLSWFSRIEDQYGGEWSKGFCHEYANWRYSVGGENKKLTVKMVEAISGVKSEDKPKTKQGVLERLGLKKASGESE